MQDLANEYHEKLIESVAELDEDLMEKYFGGEELTIDEIKSTIRKATIDNTMVPVTCGSSYRNKGVQMLLDAIVDYMPAPTDVPAIKGVDPETGDEVERPSSDKEPFAAPHSRLLLTRLLVSSASSEFTLVQFLPAQLFTTQLRTTTSVSVVSCRCTLTTEKISTAYTQVTSLLPLVLKIQQQVILSVMRRLLLSLSLWNSLIL